MMPLSQVHRDPDADPSGPYLAATEPAQGPAVAVPEATHGPGADLPTFARLAVHPPAPARHLRTWGWGWLVATLVVTCAGLVLAWGFDDLRLLRVLIDSYLFLALVFVGTINIATAHAYELAHRRRLRTTNGRSSGSRDPQGGGNSPASA